MSAVPLDALRTAVKNDDIAGVVDETASLIQAISARQDRIAVYRTLADTIRHGAPDTPAASAAIAYNETAIGFTEDRSGLHRALTTYIAGTATSAEVLSAIDSLESGLSAEQNARTELVEQKSSTDLPALLHVTTPSRVVMPKGTALEEDISLSNHGEFEARNVTIDVATMLDVSPSPSKIGTLGADQSVVVTLSGPLPDAGDFTVDMSANGEETTAGGSFSIAVLDKVEFLRLARTDLERLHTVLVEHIEHEDGNKQNRRSNRGEGRTALERAAAALDATLQQVETALHVLDRDAAVQAADSHIQNALRALARFQTAVSESSVDDVGPNAWSTLQSDARDAERYLADAVEAAT